MFHLISIALHSRLSATGAFSISVVQCAAAVVTILVGEGGVLVNAKKLKSY